jgi:hypothetical protein
MRATAEEGADYPTSSLISELSTTKATRTWAMIFAVRIGFRHGGSHRSQTR